MDTCTSNSRTSTAWKITFHLAGCPIFLQVIVRLLWFGTSIIVRHPNGGRRLQRLQCATISHPASRFQFTDAQLRGPGRLEVHEAELVAVEDLAKSFSSPEKTEADGAAASSCAAIGRRRRASCGDTGDTGRCSQSLSGRRTPAYGSVSSARKNYSWHARGPTISSPKI